MSYLPSFLIKAIRLLPVLLFSAIVVAAQAEESSLLKTAKDPNILWGPCPAFLGQGCEMAIIHGDPAEPNADVFFKVPGNFEIVNHWHTSPERIILLTGKMSVTYEGEKSGMLTPGRYAYGPAKKPHKAYCHKGEECILFIAFVDPVDAFEVK